MDDEKQRMFSFWHDYSNNTETHAPVMPTYMFMINNSLRPKDEYMRQ